MPTVEPVPKPFDVDAGPVPSRRGRWLVVAVVALVIAVIAVIAVWMVRSPAYEKFCVGGGTVGAPVRPSAEEAFEAWAGDTADGYERRANTWVRNEGGGRTSEAYVRETDGGYAVGRVQ